MTALLTYLLRCDGCGQTFLSEPPRRRATDVRVVAATSGWRNVLGEAPSGPRPSFDFCIDCEAPEGAILRANVARPLPGALTLDLIDYARAVVSSSLHKGDLLHVEKARAFIEAADRGEGLACPEDCSVCAEQRRSAS